MSAEKTDRLLHALLEANGTIKEAAEKAGIPYSTARRLLAQPEAQATLAEMRQQAAREAVIEAANLARLARETLRAVMEDADAPAHARVRAAEAALGYERAMSDLYDLSARLEAIEARLSETKGTER